MSYSCLFIISRFNLKYYMNNWCLFQVIIKDRIIRHLHMDLTEIKSQYSNCYAEVRLAV